MNVFALTSLGRLRMHQTLQWGLLLLAARWSKGNSQKIKEEP